MKTGDNKVENWLELIEHRAGAVYPAIENNEQLNNEDAKAWATFIASLFLRSRKIRMQLATTALSKIRPSNSDEDIRNYQYLMLKQGRLLPYERLKKASEKVWDEMAANPAFCHLISLDYSTPTIANALLGKAWIVCEACEGSRFITSDAPVTTMKILEGNSVYSGYGFGQPDVSVVVPISPTKVFIASPSKRKWQSIQDSTSIALINKITANFADRWVYSDSNSPETQSLVDQELGLATFGENAFRVTTPPPRKY
jgi:hypothetical protein